MLHMKWEREKRAVQEEGFTDWARKLHLVGIFNIPSYESRMQYILWCIIIMIDYQTYYPKKIPPLVSVNWIRTKILFSLLNPVYYICIEHETSIET